MERERVSVWAEMGGWCLAGVEQNFGEGCGEVGRGWAERSKAKQSKGRVLGGWQSPKMRGGLKEKLSKKQGKGSETRHLRVKISPIIDPSTRVQWKCWRAICGSLALFAGEKIILLDILRRIWYSYLYEGS